MRRYYETEPYHISDSVYAHGERELATIRTFKEGARWDMAVIDYSAGEIPEWNRNPEAYDAFAGIAAAARELEKAYRNLLALYERQEMSECPDNWEYASKRRSA